MIEGNIPRKPSDVKILICFRLLATGCSSVQLGDANYMAEKTTVEYFKSFCRNVRVLYGGVHPHRLPKAEEVAVS